MLKKGFTLIELMVVIAIIGVLAMVGLNFDFNKKTDIEKRDRFVEKVGSMMHSNNIAMTSGKGVKVGDDIINPTSVRLVFSSGAIITNYYSGTDIVWVWESLTSPFYGESWYNLNNFYYINKDSSTGAVLNSFSIVYSSNGNISFIWSDAGIEQSVMIGMNIWYHATKKTITFDRRFGKFLADKSLIETGATSSASAPVCTAGTTWDGTSCITIYVAPVAGVCNNTVNFACIVGASISNTVGSCGWSATWTCGGLNGGIDASCSKINPSCASCTGTPWWTVAHGNSVAAYSTTSVACWSTCASIAQTRTCNNGTLSGTYGNTSCSAIPCTCTLPWGGIINNGQSVTAYSTNTYACGWTPVSQIRTCTSGVLSGTYQYQTSTQLACASCTGTPWWTIAHGSSVTAYNTASVACWNICASVAQTRTCSNGVLSGTYGNTSCSVASCTGTWTQIWWPGSFSGYPSCPMPNCGGFNKTCTPINSFCWSSCWKGMSYYQCK